MVIVETDIVSSAILVGARFPGDQLVHEFYDRLLPLVLERVSTTFAALTGVTGGRRYRHQVLVLEFVEKKFFNFGEVFPVVVEEMTGVSWLSF